MTARARLGIVLALCIASPRIEAQQTPTNPLAKLSDAFRQITAAVTPSVVEISIVALGPVPSGRNRAAGVGTLGRSGSGVVLTSDGYILTNAHVVEGARTVEVLLSEAAPSDIPGRSLVRPVGRRLTATLVGTDAETDLALLKIDATDLPHLELADSDEVLPGDLVLAFGSPLGLESTVTMGVVSAVGRQLEPDAPVVYIQTDAPINPGNSGGPLVNASGQVVGINTLIASPTGVSVGIGFAVPSNIARTVFDQLREHGRVLRGIIGIEVQTITPALASGLKLSKEWGVIVSDVYPGSPGFRAGIRSGDVIMAIDGKTMENARQFNVNVYQRPAGSVIGLDVMRGADRLSVPVRVVLRDDDPAQFADLIDPDRALVRALGVLAVDLSVELVRRMPWLREPGGVVVAATAADAPIVNTGLEAGDVIYRLNQQAVGSIDALRDMLDSIAAGDAVVLEVNRRGQYHYVVFTR